MLEYAKPKLEIKTERMTSNRTVQSKSSVVKMSQTDRLNKNMLARNDSIIAKDINLSQKVSNTNEGIKPVQRKKENNTGIPDHLKEAVENVSGIDMSDVRVHYNSDKPTRMSALAYTQGNDIHIAAGQEKHLPHETWHVVQQSQGRVRPTMQMKGVSVNNDVGLEREADEMGIKVLQMKTYSHDLRKVQRNDGVVQKLSEDEIGRMTTEQQRQEAQNQDSQGGHSLARHGPDIDDKVLQDRLTTGMINGTFSPAPGIATKFENYKMFLISRVRAQDRIEGAYQNTWNKLRDSIQAHKDSTDAVNTAKQEKRVMKLEGLLKTRNDKWGDLRKLVIDGKYNLLGNNDNLPISINKEVNKICIHNNYNLVLKHEESMGTGFRGEVPKTIDNKNGFKDLSTGKVKQETIYDSFSVIPNINNTATTFDTGGDNIELSGTLKPKNWIIVTHYPDNREPKFY